MNLFLIVLLSVIGALNAQGLTRDLKPPDTPIASSQIVYPSEDTNQNRKPSHNRQPIEDNRLCLENELLYPGDHEGDWVCDCKPGFLHYPLESKCFEAYTQGPCQEGEILILREGSSIPYCSKNQCSRGLVFFNNGCYPLNSELGCGEYEKFIGRKVSLVADPTTLRLTCADEGNLYACVDQCCTGSKREFNKVCNKKRQRLGNQRGN